MKTICMITTSEIFHDTRILNEANTLSKSYQVTILAKKYSRQAAKRYPFRIKLIDYRQFGFSQLNIFSSFIELIRAALKENPDVFHGHDLDGLLCCFYPAFRKRKILIYDSHELWSDTYPFSNLRGIQWFLPILEKLLIWRVRQGITVNCSLARFLSKKYGKGFLALYNVAQANNLGKSRFDLRRKFPGKKIILHLGSADEGRGLEQMIEAMKFLPERFCLVFIGGGKTESQAKELVDKLNLKNRVRFFPAVLPKDITSTIAEADLALALTQNVSKSYFLSSPNKIFQYLSAKLPILGSNFPEFKKIIRQKNADSADKIGEVVDPAKPALIAKAMIKMTAAINQQKYRKNLQKLSKTKYNWDVESQKLIKFYEEVFR